MMLRTGFPVLSATLFLAFVPVPAIAVYPDSGVISYTGCLVTAGGGSGGVNSVTAGNNPLKPCGPNEAPIHLSGGDITKVIAGTGLTGGGDNGAVTLRVDAAYSLPLGCASGQVTKSNGSNVWVCANDNNTTYTSGTGLDLGGTQFSISQSYRLPQACGGGQSPTWNGTNWSCETYDKAGQSCPTGQFATGSASSGTLSCATPTALVAGTVYQALGVNTPTYTGEAFTGVTLASKGVPVGLYQVTAYLTTDITDLAGHDDALPPLCVVGTDEPGHSITRMVRGNNTSIGPIPWSYTVFIETTPGHQTISLICRVGGFGIEGTFFDPQINALSISAAQ